MSDATMRRYRRIGNNCRTNAKVDEKTITGAKGLNFLVGKINFLVGKIFLVRKINFS